MPGLASAQTLGQALNATNLTWTTSGTSGASGWAVESTTTHDGVSAAQSGTVLSSFQSSILQTTVTGPGTLSFWWSNPSANQLTFSVGGSNLAYILLYYPSWQQQTFYVGSGAQTLKWTLTNSTVDVSRGYLDQVSYTPGATRPIIISQPTSESQVRGLDATLAVTAGGTPPLTYQWHFQGSNIPGATGSSYTVTNLQPTNVGIYSVVVSNSIDSTNVDIPLELGEVAAWNLPGVGRTMIPAGATNVLAIAAGDLHTLLLKPSGSMLACGDDNEFGEVTIPPDLTDAIAIAARGRNSMALKADGSVLVWGDNREGQTNLPGGLTNVVAISLGGHHCLALKSDGIVVGWGFNVYGQTTVPSDLTNVVGINAGDNHSLAVKADGTVVAWGQNYDGETNVPVWLTNAVAVAGGALHSVALRSDGTVVAWGNNQYGETNVPAVLSNVVSVAADFFHTLALKMDGTVVAWGYNNFGVTNVPSALTNTVAIATGNSHNVALVGGNQPVLNAALGSPSWSSNGFRLALPSQSGRVYALQYKNSIEDADWSALPLVGGNGTNLFLTDPSATNSQRFYRVLRW